MMEDGPLNHTLSGKLQRILKDARIVAMPLPLTPGIRLYLLSPDYPRNGLSQAETQSLMDEPPYWSFCWSSGQVLAKWILEHSHMFSDKTVLDFGSGSGVLAIAAAYCGAGRVIALDMDPVARDAVKANANLNNQVIEVLDDFESAATDPIDIIVAADVLYDRDNLHFLKRFVERAPEVLIADSRVKSIDLVPYEKIYEGIATTWPDFDEPEEFRRVSIYGAQNPFSG